MKFRNTVSRLAELDFPLLLFIISAFVGLVFAHDISLTGVILLYLVAGFMLYLVVSRLAKKEGVWLAIGWVTIITCAMIALFYLTQYGRLDNTEKLQVFNRLGTFLNRIFPRLDTFNFHYNSVATLLEGPLFLAAGIALNSKRLLGRYAAWFIAGFMATILVLTVSRGAWLAIIVTSVIWLSLYWKPARYALAVGIGVFLIVLIFVLVKRDIFVLNQIPVINQTLAPLFIRPDRFAVYRDSIYLIQDYIFTGGGIGGQFAALQSRYALIIQVPFLSYSHQLYLEIWLEQGLLGIFAFLWLISSTYFSAWRYAAPKPKWLFESTWLGLTAIFLHGITDARPYVDQWIWLPIFILFALNKAIQLRRSARPIQNWTKPLPYSIPLVFLLAVLLGNGSIASLWESNIGAIQQAHSELQPGLSDTERDSLLKQSITHFQRAIVYNSKNRTAQQRMGQILMNENLFAEGVDYLEAAYQIDPNNRTTQKELGYDYAWLGKIDQSVAMLSNISEAKQEMKTYSWWWGTQGRQDLSSFADQVEIQLNQ